MRLQVDVKDTGKTLLAFLRDRLTEYPSVYSNKMKNWEFDKEVPSTFRIRRAAVFIDTERGVNGKSIGKPMQSKTNSSVCLSIKAIKRAIEVGQCKINGRVETFSTHKVKTGDWVEIRLKLSKRQYMVEVLLEDDDLILLNKPPGKTSESFTEYLLVHRLDKDTSGVILFAKTKKMQKALIDLFRQRKVEKKYLAICDGKIKEKKWIVDNYLEKKVTYQGGSLYGKAPKGKGKKAITHFCLLKSCETASLVCAKPLSGRTHQVRVHLKGRGHPVLGDYQYARHFTCPISAPRQMLHSHEIRFVHPNTHEEVHCTAEPINDFLQMQKNLFGA